MTTSNSSELKLLSVESCKSDSKYVFKNKAMQPERPWLFEFKLCVFFSELSYQA